MKRSQVTTKRGDLGETVAISGEVYSKSHPIFAACGDLDAVRARIAELRLKLLLDSEYEAEFALDLDLDLDPELALEFESEFVDKEKIEAYTEACFFLYWLLHVCFLIGAQCNDPLNRKPEYRNRDLAKVHLEKLEGFQEKLETEVTLPNFFIVSASNELAALSDLLCTDVRRLERSIVSLKEAVPEFDTTVLLPFVNRLSDTIFMLSRWLENGEHTPVDYAVLD